VLNGAIAAHGCLHANTFKTAAGPAILMWPETMALVERPDEVALAVEAAVHCDAHNTTNVRST